MSPFSPTYAKIALQEFISQIGVCGEKLVIARDGSTRDLNINELEQAMGFDRDYTHVMYNNKKLSNSKRSAKVGKSCCIETLTELFQFLKFFYKTTSV